MKREITDEEPLSGGNKRNRRNDDIVRLLIPSRIAGAVIGKGGQHIQKMRSQYKATVSVDDCQGPERTILISSDTESVLSIIKEMLKYFEEKDNEVDVRMLIHQSLAGCVIGKGGTKIKEIRDKIGCRILKVFSNVAPQSTDRIVQIIGKQEQCVDAIREVLDVMRDTPIKGSVHNYDPINFDDLYSDEYGGYGEMQNGGSGSGGKMRGGDRQSRFDRGGRGDGGRRFSGGVSGDRGGQRNDRSRSGGRRDREYINPWANDGPMGGSGPGNLGGGGGGFVGNMGGGFGGSGSFGGNSGGFGSGPGNFGSGLGNFGGSVGGGYGGSSNNFGPTGNSSFGNSSGGGNFGSGSNFGGTSGIFGGSGLGGGGGNMPNGISGGNMGSGSMGGGSSGSGYSSGMNNGGSNGADNKNSTQVTIPKDLAGAIIGKGGGRIRRIRNDSGAYITIDEPLPGSNDRIITISGNSKQIQMAQYLLQQSVHENRRKF